MSILDLCRATSVLLVAGCASMHVERYRAAAVQTAGEHVFRRFACEADASTLVATDESKLMAWHYKVAVSSCRGKRVFAVTCTTGCEVVGALDGEPAGTDESAAGEQADRRVRPAEVARRPDIAVVPVAPQRGSYALVVGIGDYRDVPDADGAGADANAMSTLFIDGLGLPEDHVRLLVDERATKTDVEGGLRWLAQHGSRGSRIYFYYSGHGAPEPATGKPYLVPYDGQPNELPETALAVDAVLGKLEIGLVQSGNRVARTAERKARADHAERSATEGVLVEILKAVARRGGVEDRNDLWGRLADAEDACVSMAKCGCRASTVA